MPAARPLPRIILLNGASSSGKSTLAAALRDHLDHPYFFLSSDQLVESGMLPRVDRSGAHGPHAWSELRPRFFAGFHGCIEAMARAGNDLLVEHVIEERSWYEDLVLRLAPFEPFFVGVHCPLPELERRERARGNRAIGEGRSHLDGGVHDWGEYDLELDTSVGDSVDHARQVARALAKRRLPSAFASAARAE